MLVRPPWVTTAALVVVLGVWTTTSVVGSVTHDWEGLQQVNLIMVIIAGWLFVIRRNGDGGSGR